MSGEAREDQALDARYRRLAAHEVGAPSEATRRAILAQARVLSAAFDSRGMPRRTSRMRAGAALFGALAASVVAGLIVMPRWTLSPAPATPAQAVVRVTAAESAAPAAPSAKAPPPAPALAPVNLPAPSVAAPPVARLRPQEQPAPVADAAPQAAPVAAHAAPPARGGADSGTPSTTALAAASARIATAAALQPPGARLRQAAEAGDLSQLEALSQEHPDLDARDALGRTALMLATLNGHASAVAALLAYGADPRLADAQGVTPLAAARAAGNGEIVAIFARYGVR